MELYFSVELSIICFSTKILISTLKVLPREQSCLVKFHMFSSDAIEEINLCQNCISFEREFHGISKYLTQLEHPFKSVIQSFQSFETSFQSKLFMLCLLLKGIYPGYTGTRFTAGSFRRQKKTFARRKIEKEFPRRDKDADMEQLIDLSDLYTFYKKSGHNTHELCTIKTNAKTTRTNWPRKVRELILDSDPWSRGVKG